MYTRMDLNVWNVTIYLPLSIWICSFWFILNNLSSTEANPLKFIHRVNDHQMPVMFNVRLHNFVPAHIPQASQPCFYKISAFFYWKIRSDILRLTTRMLFDTILKFVSDLRQVSGFSRVLRFPQPIKLTATI